MMWPKGKGKGKGKEDFEEEMFLKGKGKGKGKEDFEEEWFLKGKGKGKGKGDFEEEMFLKGKGKGKGKEDFEEEWFLKGKGKGKGKGDFEEEMFLKGKGKGRVHFKGKFEKGWGKGKGKGNRGNEDFAEFAGRCQLGRAYGATTFEEEKAAVLEAEAYARYRRKMAPPCTWDDLEEEWNVERELCCCASEELLSDKEVALACLSEDREGWVGNFSKSLRADKRFMLKAVTIDRVALEHASEELRGDKDVVLAALRNSVLAFRYASKQLRADKRFMLKAVDIDPKALAYASEELRGDKDFVCFTLKYASAELQADRDIVLAAVSNDHSTLKYASAELQADRDIVLAAVSNDHSTLKYASAELQAEKEVVLAAVAKGARYVLWHIRQELLADKEVVLAAVSDAGSSLQRASAELRADKDVVLAAVRNAGDALQYASRELRADKDVVLPAVSKCGFALEHASEELRADRDFVLAAVGKCGTALRYASEELRADRDVVLAAAAAAARGSPRLWRVTLAKVDNRFKSDKDFLLLLARTIGDCSYVYWDAWDQGVVEKDLTYGLFRAACSSALAISGQPGTAPTVNVSLSRRTDENSGSHSSLHAQGMLFSGEELDCHVPIGARVNDLAEQFVEQLQRLGKMTDQQKHIFMIFMTLKKKDYDDDDGAENPILVTPWECRRPLSDFLSFL